MKETHINIIEHFRQLFPVKSEYLEKMVSLFRPVRLKKGSYFVHEGDICNRVGFITRGAMFCYYNKDGDMAVDEFSFEMDFITDYFSFLTGSPSDKNIKCLEDTEVMVLYRNDIYAYYDEDPVYEKIGRLMAESLYLTWHEKSKSLMLDDAQTRYIKLLEKKRDLLQRVPQYLIASYLNIKPETLSRIRSKVHGGQ